MAMAPITGIAQYRGMFGDRISVKLDSAPTLTGGPNAMDTPLSYAPSGLLSDLVIYRGITPVSQAQESIGGHMVAKLNRGSFTQKPRTLTPAVMPFFSKTIMVNRPTLMFNW
jgi:iron complex outermembrane receptor protein